MPVRLANQTEPIPGYRLLERLGRGGFGEVWKCEAPGGLHKAIKFVFGELDEKKSKGGAAEQEFKALNRVKSVRHPFLLSLERVDVVEGQLVIVMELADRSLMDRFKECQKQGLPGVPREELLRYIEESAEALDLMNIEYQLQHLDIKPQNIFLVRNHVKVADFGLVKDMEGMTASVTGGVTPVYAAPETFEGRVSRFCDQYSLAIVFQELLTGHRPFDGTNARQLLLQHVQQPPNLAPLPSGDRPVIARALAKKPDERFPTCSEMAQALRNVTVPEESKPGTITPVRRPDNGTAPPSSAPAEGAVTSEMTRNLRSPAAPANVLRTPRPAPANIIRTPRPASDPAAPSVTDTNLTGPHISAPVEFRSSGILVPALVVGLGQAGLSVLQRFRAAIVERFGSFDSLAHLRLLYIDTDPDGIGTALRGSNPAGALMPPEVMLLRLNRPSHYLKPRDTLATGGAPAIASWLDPQLLYRIPRTQLTAGMRSLGRLALVDNYRDVADRLRESLGGCTEAEALASADRTTKLGLRVNRPRVYVVTSLGGGTGSGMFLDVAYLARHFLKQLGYQPTDMVGLFFVPPADKTALQSRPLELGNAYAALTELNYFSAPGVSFGARYDSKEPPLVDGDAPFSRCIVLAHEDAEDEKRPETPAGLAANFLLGDLLTPLGRTADAQRAALMQGRPGSEPAAKGPPPLQTLGTFRLAWPRRALISLGARRLGQRLVDHWLAKDAAPFRGEMQDWAQEQFNKRDLEAEQVILNLKAAAEGALDQELEDAFDAIVERARRSGPVPDPYVALEVLEELEKLVGRPEGQSPLPQRPVLLDSLEDAAQKLLQTCEQNLAEMTVQLVEQPRFRFAGAEEAIRQVSTLIQEILSRQEPLCDEFVTKANTAHRRILGMVEVLKAASGSTRRKLPEDLNQLPNLLRLYPMVRFQSVLMQRVLMIYRSLQGNCPEYQREFTYCRTRLTDLQRALAKPMLESQSVDLGPGRNLLPAGCKTVEEAVAQLLQNITPTDVITLDARIQEAVIEKQFQAMVHVCTTPASNIIRDLEKALQEELEEAVRKRLGTSNVLDTFLGQSHREAGAVAEVANAFDRARPSLPGMAAAADQEVSVVVVPGEPAAEQFEKLAKKALPTAEVVVGPKSDDVVFYREQQLASLDKLPQLGGDGRAAYEKLNSAEHCTAHNRTDITAWQPAGR